MKSEKHTYYCDGICETCKYSKIFKDKTGEWYTCNPDITNKLKIIAPTPPNFLKK